MYRLIQIQVSVAEAQRLLALLFEHPNPANLELVQTLEAALEDAAITDVEEDYSIDE